jgi:hypothetical protein
MHRFTVLLLFPILFFSCQLVPEEKEVLELQSYQFINDIPSASGVSVVGEEVWMVGDDSPYLYSFDHSLKLLEKFQLSGMVSSSAKRVDKSIKADYESMVKMNNQLFVLGSGSSINSRDTLVVFDLVERKVTAKHNLRPLFNRFLEIGGFDTTQQINIEALATNETDIFFFNRGNIGDKNDIYQILREDFQAYLTGNDSIKIKKRRFKLPQIDGYTSGFSGACFDQQMQYLYFTSSVEATNDVYNDGEVLGSFIGRIDLKSSDLKYWPLKENKQFVKTKLESIAILENTKEFLKFVCTSDNDDGSSGVYHIQLNLKSKSHEK